MRRSRRRTRSKSKWIGRLFFIVFVVLLSVAGVTEAKVIKMQRKNGNLKTQINDIETNKKNLAEKNKKLLANIEEKQNLYKKKMENVKIAYLTFDDGPSSNTQDILDILDKYDIKATWFVNAHKNLEYLYKKIDENGHVIANHGYSHDYDKIYKSVDSFKENAKKLEEFISNITGKPMSKMIRYNGGSNNTKSHRYGGNDIMTKIIKEMDKEGYVYFDWNVDSTDASKYRQDKDKIVSSVLNYSKRKKQANILMHDLNPKTTTVQALPEIIEGLQKQGFIFDVLSENSYKPQFKKVK
ncbi:polysaccharide deacetylase [Clostridium aestuarii]|uniref:Polysaccharide deacetylase n=1 Tax=Clostridium aestuarii TaxID=338193 RepID=A0ABT4D026_9CLOT|nr:polysaccharide deacetylase family protein [Clostridium aestuarii]MCY6483535.1 polysaccharide deacetylase [Clostridium aestuarii]